ncbi:MAG: glycosyltransferase family 2 protein [Proteobacteria bacterium]|nr:glycosyltransferase family 2 protein [Pseudomonadota bacterium]
MTHNSSALKTLVLLASYNGEKFLAEQLDSLLQQSLVPSLILIRDDGSTDSTAILLDAYQRRYPGRIQVLNGPRLGFVGNFLELIALAPHDFDFYFFCDQDDVWLPSKINQTINLLKAQNQQEKLPQLAFGRLRLVDESLNVIGESPHIERWDFGNALFESPITGCTVAMNQAMCRLLQSRRAQASCIIAHDWWCYLLATAFGHLVYEPLPLILYRQHAANSLGAKQGRWQDLTQRWKNYRQGTWAKRRPEPMIQHFLELYGDRLAPDKTQLLLKASLRQAGFWPAFQLWLRGDIWRRGTLNHLILLILLFKKPRAIQVPKS